ncbi:hypothetical protein Emed_003432 [Eimeria media]
MQHEALYRLLTHVLLLSLVLGNSVSALDRPRVEERGDAGGSATETPYEGHAWKGGLGNHLSATSLSAQHSLSTFTEDVSPLDPVDVAAAARELPAAFPSASTPVGAAQGKLKKKHRHVHLGVAAAAVACFLLLFTSLSVRSRLQRLPAEAQVGEREEEPGAEFFELEAAAKAAAEKVQYLEQVAADGARLASRYKTNQVAQALGEIRSALSDAKEQQRAILLHLEGWQQQQEQKQKQQQEQEEKEKGWEARVKLLDEAYSTAVTAAYDLLKAALPPLSASISDLSENTRRLKITTDKTQRLCQNASAKLDPAEADLLKIYRVAVQLDEKKGQSEVSMLHAATQELEDRVGQQAREEAPPAELLKEALAVSQLATEGRIRMRELTQVASGWSEEGEQAVIALCRSFAISQLVEVADLRKQSVLVRFMLQTVPIPEEYALQKEEYMLAGETLDEASPFLLQQLHQDLQDSNTSTVALAKLHLVRSLHKKASEEMEKAPSIAVIPAEDEKQSLALSFDGNIVKDILEEETDEEKRTKQTCEMRALLVAAVTDALKKISIETLSFDEETERQLMTEGGDSSKRFEEVVLPSRQHFQEWKKATNKMEEAKAAAEEAAQRLEEEKDRSVLQRTADEALRQARLVATYANAATHHWLKCSVWLKVEKDLMRALNSYSEAYDTVQQREQLQQHSQSQELQHSQLQEVVQLQAEAKALLQNENIEAAARLAADVAEQARQTKFSLH